MKYKSIKQYLTIIRSTLSMLILKINNRASFSYEGLPISLLPHNIRFSGGDVNLGKHINLHSTSCFIVAGGGKLKLGSGVFANNNVICCCRGKIEINNSCRFGPNVCIYDHDHIFSSSGVTDEYKVGEIIIEDNCWIGANVTILRDTHIGQGCVIGAGTVVKGSIPAHSIVTPENRSLSIRRIEEKN